MEYALSVELHRTLFQRASLVLIGNKELQTDWQCPGGKCGVQRLYWSNKVPQYEVDRSKFTYLTDSGYAFSWSPESTLSYIVVWHKAKILDYRCALIGYDSTSLELLIDIV
jgi:hypothetical protein